MLIGANDFLGQDEIEDRERFLSEVKEELELLFKGLNLPLSIDEYLSSLEPGYPDCMVYSDGNQPRFDRCWVENRVKKVTVKILDDLSNLITKDINSIPIGNGLLRGSSYFVSCKLTIKFLFGEKYIEQDYFQMLELPEPELWNITLDKIAEDVDYIYRKKYMRYRLWDSYSLDALANYLFHGDGDTLNFYFGAWYDRKNDNGKYEKISKPELLEMIEDQLLEYPVSSFTEIEYPPFSRSGYIFAEYLPIHMMDDDITDYIYQKYLDLC